MADEIKVADAPVVETPKATEPVEESLIDKRRAEIENLVIAENDTVPEPEVVPEEAPKEEKKEEPKKEEPKVEEDPLDRIKKSVQKRIDKVVAQKKSIEEELAETKAELERLKSNPKTPESVKEKSDEPPTVEQVEAYIIKMREEGNVKEEVAAMRYLLKLEKESAVKEYREQTEKAQKEESEKSAKQLSDWTNLQKDYIVYDASGKPDIKSELTLSNQKGILYQTALALYQDKELHKDFYNDPDIMQGFRRAVADAYREIHQQGLIKTPKGETVIPEKRNPRMVLAEPESEVVEDSETSQKDQNSLSDAEKVREEIKARNKNRFIRKVPS